MSVQGATSGGFLKHAKEFLVAGELVLNNATEVSLPAYFLLGRSIELSLKAFLLCSGMNATDLKRKFGHNLLALLDAAIKKGLEEMVKLEPVEVGVIRLLSYDYMEKRFEYRETAGTYYLPLIDVTERVSRRLVVGLESFCSRGDDERG